MKARADESGHFAPAPPIRLIQSRSRAAHFEPTATGATTARAIFVEAAWTVLRRDERMAIAMEGTEQASATKLQTTETKAGSPNALTAGIASPARARTGQSSGQAALQAGYGTDSRHRPGEGQRRIRACRGSSIMFRT